MKKLITITILVLCTTFMFANQSVRVQTLGGNTVMIQDDVSNVAIFPQTAANFNLFMVNGVGTGWNNYLVSHGAWTLAGGDDYRGNFFQAIHQLDPDRAYSVAVNFNSDSEELDDWKVSSTWFGITTVYGWNSGDAEYAFYGGFMYGPGYIDPLEGWMTHPVDGNSYYSNGYYSNWEDGTYDGSGSTLDFWAGFRMRRPADRDIFGIPFSHEYADASFGYWSEAGEYGMDGSNSYDLESSGFWFDAEVQIFNEKSVAGSAKLFYGTGTNLYYRGQTDTENINDTEITGSEFILTVPQCWIGLETNHKYGQFRFGASRGIDLIYILGGDDGNDEYSQFNIGDNGWFQFNTGFGAHYGNLFIDISLNQQFYITGPQMIFTDDFGTLGGTADVYYVLGN